MKIYNSKRIPIAILDTGFDITHPLLTYKLYQNPNEPIDEIDNDNNGWVDDYMGWHRTDEPVLNLDISRNNIQELVYLTHESVPVSHGTHVAGIALKGLNAFGLIGYAGDMSDLSLLKNASKNLKELNIEFMNMSMAYGGLKDPFAPPRESFHELENLISSNPHTLFTIAANNGNPGMNLDAHRNRTYPASFNFDNTFVVGALDTDDIREKDMENYKQTRFSYYGEETVDIFAPGQNVNGPKIGGGMIKFSGTSMSAPYVLNIALKAKELLPTLSSMTIKKIIMDTAYIPNKRLPCKSGGMIYPKRVLAVVNKLKSMNSLDQLDAIIFLINTTQ